MEHQSIHNCAALLQNHGFDVTIIKPNEYGLITEEILAAHIRPDTGLVSIQHANSETGIIQPIKHLSSYLHNRQILLHCDAVQTFGKLPIHTEEMGWMLSLFPVTKFTALKESELSIFGRTSIGNRCTLTPFMRMGFEQAR